MAKLDIVALLKRDGAVGDHPTHAIRRYSLPFFFERSNSPHRSRPGARGFASHKFEGWKVLETDLSPDLGKAHQVGVEQHLNKMGQMR